VGTVLTGLPLLAPVVLAGVFAVSVGGLHVDYLMPGELFALAAVGGMLILVASFLARRMVAVISIFTGAAVVLFLSTGWAAGVTGLASGRTAARGWPVVVVSTTYAAYVAAVFGLFVCGVLLCRTLFRRRLRRAASAADI
jgi:hypothetical protein